MSRPRLLDLYCKAGGASVGYDRAGFEVEGVDIEPQPHYPYAFHQADALEFVKAHGHEFDAIHASPPCQAYTTMARMGKASWIKREHPRLIEPTRDALLRTGVPYIIENVPGAPLIEPVILCGSSFGLGVRRHRLFECSFSVLRPMCQHKTQLRPVAVYGDHPQISRAGLVRINRARTLAHGQEVMDIDWMTWRELTQAIPPAFTEFLGTQLLGALERAA